LFGLLIIVLFVPSHQKFAGILNLLLHCQFQVCFYVLATLILLKNVVGLVGFLCMLNVLAQQDSSFLVAGKKVFEFESHELSFELEAG